MLLFFILLLSNNCILPLISFIVICSLIPKLSNLFNTNSHKTSNIYIIPIIKSIRQIIKSYHIYEILLISYLFIGNSLFIIPKCSFIPYNIQSIQGIQNRFKRINHNNSILLVQAQLTADEKNLLLNLHIKTRNDVQSTNMQKLSWSTTLASEAQEYAEECHGLVHSGVMGENLATATYHDVERLYHLWEDERKLFEQSDSYRQKYPGSHAFGHYTQIVWAANTKVGCGQAYCKNLSQPYNLVCRYEIGNIIGYQVYSYSSTTVERPNIIRKPSRTKSPGKPTNEPGGNGNGNGNGQGQDPNTEPTNPNDIPGGPNDNNENSAGNGVDVVATDNGNGGIILAVVGGTAASGAFALLYVKKKKPEQYKKLCRQISTQQKEISKITKRLTVKVSHGTSTLGRKIIERSRSSGTLGRHFKSHTFNRSKSSNDIYHNIYINLSDDIDLPYKFNVNNIDDITAGTTTTTTTHNNSSSPAMSFYSMNEGSTKGTFLYSSPSISNKRNSYRKLSFSSLGRHTKKGYDDYPQNNKAIPVPTYDMDIIEKMNNLDKYEQYITQSKSSSNASSSNESRPPHKMYQSPIMRDRKGSDSSVEYGYGRRSSKTSVYSSASETAPLIGSALRYNNYEDSERERNTNDHYIKVAVLDPDLQPPLPIRYKTRARSSSQNSNVTASPVIRPRYVGVTEDGIKFPRRNRSLSQSSTNSRGRLKKQTSQGSLRSNSRGRSYSRGRSFTRSHSFSRSRSRSRSRSSSRSSSGDRSYDIIRSRSCSPSPITATPPRNNWIPFSPNQRSMPSPEIGPTRMQRKNSLKGRRPRPGHEPSNIFNLRRSSSFSGFRRQDHNIQSDEYHNIVINDLLQSYH